MNYTFIFVYTQGMCRKVKTFLLVTTIKECLGWDTRGGRKKNFEYLLMKSCTI